MLTVVERGKEITKLLFFMCPHSSMLLKNSSIMPTLRVGVRGRKEKVDEVDEGKLEVNKRFIFKVLTTLKVEFILMFVHLDSSLVGIFPENLCFGKCFLQLSKIRIRCCRQRRNIFHMATK